jgi:hypothetical protein
VVISTLGTTLGRFNRLLDDAELQHHVRSLLLAFQLVDIATQATKGRAGLNVLCDGDGNDRRHTTAMTGDVRDPAAHSRVVDDVGQRRAQLADPLLIACGRRHTRMVTEIHMATHVYTNLVGSETTGRTRKPP